MEQDGTETKSDRTSRSGIVSVYVQRKPFEPVTETITPVWSYAPDKSVPLTEDTSQFRVVYRVGIE